MSVHTFRQHYIGPDVTCEKIGRHSGKARPHKCALLTEKKKVLNCLYLKGNRHCRDSCVKYGMIGTGGILGILVCLVCRMFPANSLTLDDFCLLLSP